MARVVAIKDQYTKNVNQNWIWQEFDFNRLFGSRPCLLCMKHHPKKMTQFDPYAPKPVEVVLPYDTYEDKFGPNDCNMM